MGLVGDRGDVPWPPPEVEVTSTLDVAMSLVGGGRDIVVVVLETGVSWLSRHL